MGSSASHLLSETAITVEQRQALAVLALMAYGNEATPDWSAVAWSVAGTDPAVYAGALVHLENCWEGLQEESEPQVRISQ